MMKCSKKLEKLARALTINHLLSIAFPIDKIIDRVNESWMCYYEEASELNKVINTIDDFELDGEFSEEQLACWGEGAEE